MYLVEFMFLSCLRVSFNTRRAATKASHFESSHANEKLLWGLGSMLVVFKVLDLILVLSSFFLMIWNSNHCSEFEILHCSISFVFKFVVAKSKALFWIRNSTLFFPWFAFVVAKLKALFWIWNFSLLHFLHRQVFSPFLCWYFDLISLYDKFRK